MKKTIIFGMAFFLSAAFGPALGGESGFREFITARGDRLMEGDKPFRFLSFNIPNLHYVEDDLRFDQSMPFRLPDQFEIDDALGTIAEMGGRVVRIYALSIRKADDPPDLPRYILGPGKFNEEAFAALDQVLAAANRHGVRLIIPFVDQWSWWGGMAELAAFRGKNLGHVWTDPQLIEDYKILVSYVLNRQNTVTGVRYRDDKAVLAWETGNELRPSTDWTRQITAYLKSLDPHHLVIDGAQRELLTPAALEDPHVDFVQTHHYEKDPRAMIDHIRRNRELTRDKKPYFLGEFGFLGTEALGAVMDTVIDEQIAGALLWSLRPHNRDGGFYWHQEPLGGDYFKAYHWPGFCIGEKYDERRLMRRVREKAYQIRGLTPPPLSPPAAPRVLSVDGGAQITWQGSTGANGYDIQRADALEGPWISVGSGVSDARVQYRPLFVDESARPGKSYDYRVIARNAAGGSKPSPVVGPVRITHQTLVDELWNGSRIFLKQGQFQFLENQTRKYKEDCHRLSGTPDSFLVYYVPGGVDAVRILLFAPSDKPALRISFSRDGRNFEPVEPRTMPTITYGESAYGYVKAVRYSAKPHAAGENYVKLEFLTEAQISRIEIDHDRVD